MIFFDLRIGLRLKKDCCREIFLLRAGIFGATPLPFLCCVFGSFLFDGQLLVWLGVFGAFFEVPVSCDYLVCVSLLPFAKIGVFANTSKEMGFFCGEVERLITEDFADLNIEGSCHKSC